MDAGVDTGDIIAQAEVICKPDALLGEYYNQLHATILDLFKENWNEIKEGRCERVPQRGIGSHHNAIDREIIAHLLQLGEKTPVDFSEKA